MITFYKTPFHSEYEEFANLLRPQDIDVVEKIYDASFPVPLTDAMWSKLRNTDSWTVKKMSDVTAAIKNNALTSGNRDVRKILQEFKTRKVRAPIVAVTGNAYYLIAGNTRLMVCKLLRIRPKVMLVKIPNMAPSTIG